MKQQNGAIFKEIYCTTIDYFLFPVVPTNRSESTMGSTKKMELSKIIGTTASGHSLPLSAYLSPIDSTENKIIWSSEDDEEPEYKVWPTQFNVEKNKSWKITFALPYDPRMDGRNEIYVLDRMGNEMDQSFFYSGDERTTTLTIKPNTDYIPGESYTLFIKNVVGGNGEVLEQFAKMDFTIALGIEE